MEILIKIAQFILSFSLLVFVHELGHFLTARMFGIRVEKFYIFFNPWFSLVKFRIGQTEYGIGWIPFGGYCKIGGMIDESMDTEQMAEPPKPDDFRSKPAWKRLIVMLGGVIMNVLLALVIYIGMTWKWGDEYIANDDIKYGWVFNEMAHEIGFRDGDRIVSVNRQPVEDASKVFAEIIINNAPDVEVMRDGQKQTISIPMKYVSEMLKSPDFMDVRIPFVAGQTIKDSGAERAGIQSGDSLVAVDGQPMIWFDQYQNYISGSAGKTVEITFERDSAGIRVPMTLRVDVSEEGKIGIAPYGIARYVPIQTHRYNFFQSIPAGFKRTGKELSDYVKQIKMLLTPGSGAHESLGGPLMIGNIFPGSWDWFKFWRITGFISVALAIMNLLPIPGLDGGHVIFTIYEMITRRKPSDKFLEYATMIGLLLLVALMIYVTWNDIQRFFLN